MHKLSKKKKLNKFKQKESPASIRCFLIHLNSYDFGMRSSLNLHQQLQGTIEITICGLVLLN